MMKKIAVIASVVLFGFIAGGWGILLSEKQVANSHAVSKQDEIIRLHVIANSDSPFDQNVKIKVRNALLDYLTPRLEAVSSANKAHDIINLHQAAIVKIANEVLSANNAGYNAKMETGVYDFPIKAYGAAILPAGKYQAVRILLGQASGKNWWCVLFPPLCFIDINSAVAAQPVAVPGKMPEKEAGQPIINFKWKLAEIWQNSQ